MQCKYTKKSLHSSHTLIKQDRGVYGILNLVPCEDGWQMIASMGNMLEIIGDKKTLKCRISNRQKKQGPTVMASPFFIRSIVRD